MSDSPLNNQLLAQDAARKWRVIWEGPHFVVILLASVSYKEYRGKLTIKISFCLQYFYQVGVLYEEAFFLMIFLKSF